MRQMLRLMLAMFLLMLASRLTLTSRSHNIASKKTYAVQARLVAHMQAVGTALGPIMTAGNGTFLSTVEQQAAPAKLTGYGGSTVGAPPTSGGTAAGCFTGNALTYMDALQSDINTLISYVSGNIPTAVNDIYDGLQGANIFS